MASQSQSQSHIVPIMQSVAASETVNGPDVVMSTSPQATSTGIASLSPERSSPTLPRQQSVKLSVPLDARSTVTTTRKLLRRDSLERREALLKGKEGSRQRRRWENGKSYISPFDNHDIPADPPSRPSPLKPPRRTTPPIRLPRDPNLPRPSNPLLPRPPLGRRRIPTRRRIKAQRSSKHQIISQEA